MESPQDAAKRIVDMLGKGRSADKEAAMEELKARGAPEFRQSLRQLLIDKLNDYKPEPKQDQPESLERSGIRGWLLTALGCIVGTTEEALELVQRYLNPEDVRDEWSRYWGLVGLVNSKLADTDLQSVAKEVLRLEGASGTKPGREVSLAWSLATVILASLGDEAKHQDVRDCLEKRDRRAWAMLRALRVRPLHDEVVIQLMCKAVDEVRTHYSDISYDAIFALGQVPRDWMEAIWAAQALQSVVHHVRSWESFDAMRQRAILGLGNLRARQSVETLLADLTDANPSIAQAAAVSLERVLGTEATVSRILEAASAAKSEHADMSRTMRLYASALRNMNERKVVERLDAAAVSDVEDQELARLLLVEVGGMHAFQSLRVLTSAVKNYQEALRQAEQAIRIQFDATMREARVGFAVALGMDILVFVLGIVLLSVSAASALGGEEHSLATWVGVSAAGGVGVLGVLYGTLVAEPRVQVQKAVDHMMQLKVVFLGYLRQLHQIDQLYTRRMLENSSMTAKEVQHFADTVKVTVADAMRHIVKLDPKRMAAEGHSRKPSVVEGNGHDRSASDTDGPHPSAH